MRETLTAHCTFHAFETTQIALTNIMAARIYSHDTNFEWATTPRSSEFLTSVISGIYETCDTTTQ